MPTDAAQAHDEFEDTPAGWAQRWATEMKHADAEVAAWHESGARIVKRFRDERDGEESATHRLNLFFANVSTQLALLYGRTPQVSVERRYTDAADDVGRVAGLIQERLLNADIERKGDTFADAMEYAMLERLLPGMGVVRVRYEAKTEEAHEGMAQGGSRVVPSEARNHRGALAESMGGPVAAGMSEGGEPALEVAPMAPTTPAERITYECVHTDWIYWKDFRWSPGARVWHEVRWVAFKSLMSPRSFTQRFGVGDSWAKKVESVRDVPRKHAARADDEKAAPDPWARIEVWEIWDKDSGRVFWWVAGCPRTLGGREAPEQGWQEDPYQLEGFFPCPRPLLANSTTETLLPRPDFVLAQDLYDEIDSLTTRIFMLQDAIAVKGVYPRQDQGTLDALVTEKRNKLFPVDNWAMFAEKGGLRGVIDWYPLDQVVNAIAVLSQQRTAAKEHLYEVTGQSDLMRGQALAGATATQDRLKASFGSVRLQRLQTQLARFATETQQLKGELVRRFYSTETITRQSNILFTPDAAMAEQAVALLREIGSQWRVEVKPEAVSITDLAQMRSDRTEALSSMSSFFQAAAPVAQALPGSMPLLLEVFKWYMAAQRGGASIEGVLDRAIASAQQAAAQPQQQGPDPKAQAQLLKTQGELAKVKAESEARLVEISAETQAHAIQESTQRKENVLEAAQKQALTTALRPPQQPGPVRGPGGMTR